MLSDPDRFNAWWQMRREPFDPTIRKYARTMGLITGNSGFIVLTDKGRALRAQAIPKLPHKRKFA